jgi:hypothetical protein
MVGLKMNRSNQNVNSTSLVLIGVGILLLCAAVFLTPDTFISLGPLRRSLTSDNDLVRSTAFLEVAFFRGFCGLAALIVFIASVFRNRLKSNRLWIKVSQHQPTLTALKDFGTLNFSLKIVLLLATIGLIFILNAPIWMTPSAVDIIVEEDGVVEYVSAVLFLISSILAIVLLVRYQMPTRHRVMLALLAFCLFVFFGEEISWGQRIFGFETLEVLAEANVQNENNIHNLFGYLFPSLFLLAVIVYGVIFPFAVTASRTMHQLLDLVGLAIASRGLAIGFLVAVLFRDWTFEKFVDAGSFVPSAEVGEMLISVGFLLLIIEFAYSLEDYRSKTVS